MKHPKYILSNETKISRENVAFSGFVHACRNLGHVVFFLLKDAFGMIQVVWQKSALDTKTTDLLARKKMYVLGTTRLREQKATSSAQVNNLIEIEAEDCFLIDTEKNLYSLLIDHRKMLSLLREKGPSALICEDDRFQSGLFHFHLTATLRHTMLELGFIEMLPTFNQEKVKKSPLSSIEENLKLNSEKGFDRHFYFKKKFETSQSASLEMHMTLPSFNVHEAFFQANHILNVFLSYYGWEKLESIEHLSAQDCLSKYGSLEPDFRYPFCISDASAFLELDPNIIDCQTAAYCLCVPNMGNTTFILEKIIDFVREQTGLSISYVFLDEELQEGPLKKYIKSSFKVKNAVLFFAHFSDAQQSWKALGTVYQYLRKEQLCFEKKCDAKWVTQSQSAEEHASSSYSLILNGQKIAHCYYELHSHSFLNRAFITFDLLSLNPDLWQEKEKKKQDSKTTNRSDCFQPRQSIALPISKNELEREISINDAIERDQLIAILDLDSKSTYLFWGKIEVLAATLKRFAMNIDDALFLIQLLPEKIDSVLKLAEHELFQFLWSLLGHKHVVASLQDNAARKTLEKICRLQIVTEYKQLLFLELKTISLIDFILESYIENVEIIIKIIKSLLNSSPNDFSNLINCLFELISVKKHPISENLTITLLRLSRLGYSTPGFFNFFLQNQKEETILAEFLAVVRCMSSMIFPNTPIESHFILDVFARKLQFIGIKFDVSDQTFYEILFYLFKPLNMDFPTFKHYYAELEDRSTDITHVNKIGFKGKNWDPIERCFFFAHEHRFLRIYASKNTASFFAKASAGICTGIDLALFKRPDHFHLNLVNPKDSRVVGNVQAYVFNNAQKKVLFIRGLNPSASYLNEENMGFIFNAIIEAAIQITENSELDQLLLCPSLGIWHVESSRKEIIGLIRLLCKKLTTIALDQPFLLFHFASQDNYINFAYLLWSRAEDNSSSSHPNTQDYLEPANFKA